MQAGKILNFRMRNNNCDNMNPEDSNIKQLIEKS